MLIGHVRVLTADQNLALQTDALIKAGCEKLFTDKASGAKADRLVLVEASRFARAGDRIVVCKLDRLGRSIQGLISLAADLSARKLLAAGTSPPRSRSCCKSTFQPSSVTCRRARGRTKRMRRDTCR